MSKIEKMLEELKIKEEQDKLNPNNKSEFLEQQEQKNDEDLKLLLLEQERILKLDKQSRF